ncbi:iron-containing alcohol dehydrogenase [Gloeomargarita lithophora Alchichica-D10]|uniref:Iron-containing alcohol dehydrogenase n=1 Tax=Gloeomargarita lithophora Alchichica-D10 TaxID=1188229 RepID=A0A1J0ABV0_9CYAN|nr:iron-containing alcohol dehydrogenase family protein [Gloeomargarita lithophora]APB33377.1 iron-containing alcohol dehydrogenase [Gloeomargarita lithophora Alchichica-D10]
MTELVIAPRAVLRGRNLIPQCRERLAALTEHCLLVGGATSGNLVLSRLRSAGIAPVSVVTLRECTEAQRQELAQVIASQGIAGVIAGGGGKALDAGKLAAHDANLPVVTIPTTGATCAAWTALSNLYSPAGAFQSDVPLRTCPELLLLDYDLIQTAPPRTLVAGIGDALAKWYEAAVSSGESGDTPVVMAVQQARVLRDILLQKAVPALKEPGGQTWQEVVDATVLMAGLMGGVGGASCRTVAAHAVHNGLTHWPQTHRWYHGEKVAFGILVQLRLEEAQGYPLAGVARAQLLNLYRQIDLPCTLSDLGLGALVPEELLALAQVICQPGSDIHRLPFGVTPVQVVQALQTTTQPWAKTQVPAG